jgi:pilus assembly protein CpaB
MKPRVIIFGALALLIAFGTAHFARNWLASQRAAIEAERKPEKPAVRILVAAHDLATGSFLRVEDLRWQSWPDSQINESYLRADRDQSAPQSLAGAVVRSRIAAGEPISKGRVIKPGERGFLAAVLMPGMRAVSVPVTATSGVAGLVFPGDRVDLVLSHAIKEGTSPNAPSRIASETVLCDLRVLAVDQTTDDKDGKPMLAKTVTFEVTPKQVEAIEVASELGKLYLSLRSLGHQDDGAETQVAAVTHTWDSDVSPLLKPQARRPDGPVVVTVLRGEPARGGGAPMPSPGAASPAAAGPAGAATPAAALAPGASGGAR